MARTMLIDNGVVKGFWAEAVNTTCYLVNRCMIMSLLNKTLYELLNEGKLKLTNLRMLGCKCFVLNNSEEALGKFDTKTDEENRVFRCSARTPDAEALNPPFMQTMDPIQSNIGLLTKRFRSKTRSSLAFSVFLLKIEPKNIKEALKDAGRITAMQDELHQVERNRVWHLVPRPSDRTVIGTRFELKYAVLEVGVPFDRVHDVHGFEYQQSNPKFNDVFNKAMINHTTVIMKRILENYKGFENIKSLVDVGGSLGVNLKMITSKYPTIKGTSFDLPHVIQYSPFYRGVEHVGGDMFDSVPEGDAIFMKETFLPVTQREIYRK
uniref:3'-hydroxy-N-methyl-(S)-coclaurine 4'-O-methyltransferase-like n=1 Tax=Nicotiana sylvestris TaxID=4096 RepID=A0A1U7YK45_NICSY|nr:PREDICTED: 3'-hydroxy-N-methyl-(S)-coclaurine 4'-O-methyltransferase-like [Nicotiana sylvestris]